MNDDIKCTKGLYKQSKSFYHLAPIPFIMHEVLDNDMSIWHNELIKEARLSYSKDQIEVPDVRHINDMGNPPEVEYSFWKENHNPAIGVWHRVPTNNFLSLKTDSVIRLKSLIEELYIYALHSTGYVDINKAYISESWIQFYTNSDYKVLHNHERYGPPFPSNSWSGAYYICDGKPDASMPYSGRLSFRIRNENYIISPRAGLLLIWPSDLLHEVHPFYGKDERIVINFNVNSNPVKW